MVEKLLRRQLPGVEIIKAGEELAHEVADALRRRGLLRTPSREGRYEFACSGDPDTFREVGGRFLQMPLGAVTQVEPGAPVAGPTAS